MKKHIQTFKIRTYETDRRQQLTAMALWQLMQETSLEHTYLLKLSFKELEEQNLNWVLTRLHLTFNKYPTIGDEIQIETYPTGFDRFFAFRDYLVYDGSGNLLAQASSEWVLFNTSLRRMSRMPEYFNDYVQEDRSVFLPKPGRIKISPDFSPSTTQSYQVSWFDVDFNHHLSNNIFIKWMLECMEPDFLGSHRLTELIVQFKAEAVLGEELVVSSCRLPVSGCRYQHQVLKTDTGRILCISESEWV